MGFRLIGKRASLLLTVLAALAASTACGSALNSSPGPKPDTNPQTVQADAIGVSAIAQLNNYRAFGSLPPVSLDPRLSIGAQLHANYLALNSVSLSQVGLDAHVQSNSMPGFTEQGYHAGLNSVIYEGVTAVTAIDNWMQTFYHRLGLMDPNLTHVGFGSQGRYQVMDIGQGRIVGFSALDAISQFPWPEMTIEGDYVREIPHPIPGNFNVGVPITLEFFGQRGASITNVGAALYDQTGRELGCYVQYPGKPFLPGWDMQQLICLIPHSPLPQGRYTVAIDATVDGLPFPFEWSFNTK